MSAHRPAVVELSGAELLRLANDDVGDYADDDDDGGHPNDVRGYGDMERPTQAVLADRAADFEAAAAASEPEEFALPERVSTDTGYPALR